MHHSFIHNLSGDTLTAHYSIFSLIHHQLNLYEEMMNEPEQQIYDDHEVGDDDDDGRTSGFTIYPSIHPSIHHHLSIPATPFS